LLASTAITACTATVTGVPVLPSAGLSTSLVNIAELDTVAYPVTPVTPWRTAGTSPRGRVLEGHRLADYVVRPHEVYSSLLRQIPQDTATLDSVHDVPNRLPLPLTPMASSSASPPLGAR
jgi:hypothetical protein